MCTAISFKRTDHYFGRNLDLEYHYNEEVVVTPENFNFPFRNASLSRGFYPMIGMATVIDHIPLYYDATNIYGLSMAGLNFPGNAEYKPIDPSLNNIAPFELIPWILAQCKSVAEAKDLLRKINITNTQFSDMLPITPLHWMLSDDKESVVIESVKEGVFVYDNPVYVLTNSPPFPYHLYHLRNFLNLTNQAPDGDLTRSLHLKPYSNGVGGVGLPGDLSSDSRFIKATYLLLNSVCDSSENSCVSQFFHILDAVAHPRGCVKVGKEYEITYYSSCCNATKGIYYYKTYDNSRICAVKMDGSNLTGKQLHRYPLYVDQDIFRVNH